MDKNNKKENLLTTTFAEDVRKDERIIIMIRY